MREASKNLKTFAERSPEERSELGRLGGLRSGESRRERRKLKEELEALLSDGETQKSVCIALIEKAISGDAKAFAILRDTLGENPANKIEAEIIKEPLSMAEKEEIIRSLLG